MAEISILVPVYNVENYLEACLDSILAQTYTDFELLCMDDGSTDRSGEILDEYARRDNRIKVIHKKNSGYGNTMNMALQMVRGNYIGIVESDDIIEKDMYQVLYDAAVRYDLDMVKSDFYYMWENTDGTFKRQYFGLTDSRDMYNRVWNPDLELEAYLVHKFTWNALYRRELIIQNDIRYNETPGASYQDNGFWFQTFYWARRVMFLDRPFYNYRQDNMAASSHSRQKVYAMKNEFDFIRNFMMTHGETRKELYQICFHLRMLAYLFTLERIALSLKIEFARTIKTERMFFERRGEACYDWLTREQMEIIKNPLHYIDEVLVGCHEISQAVLGYDTIIVYGAGAYGERVVYRARESKTDQQILKVAVSRLDMEQMECQGIEVCEIAECVTDREKSLVILAVKEGTDAFYEMSDYVKQLGFLHVITVSARRI